MKKEEYLDIVEEQIRCRQAREGVRKELAVHIEDQAEWYRLQGMGDSEAEEMAVCEMGDPVETGNMMDEVHRPKMAWKSIAVIVVLSLVTFVLQYILTNSAPDSMNMYSAWIPGGAPKYLLIHAVGWAVMIGICYLDYTRIGKYAGLLMIVGCVGTQFLTEVYATPVNGREYFQFAEYGVSVRMVCFLFLPLYGAVLYQYRGRGYRGVLAGILWMIPSLLIPMLDRGMLIVVIVGSTYLIMLTVAICKGWFRVPKKITVVGLWSGTIFLIYAGINYIRHWGAPYQVARLDAFEDPFILKTGVTSTTVMMRNLLAGSRLVGTKAGFMRDAEGIMWPGDYTLSLICAYYGILAAAILVAGIALLFIHFFHMSFKQKNQLGMIMGTGCSTVFLVQLLLYIMGNMGLLLSGTSYCPFLGYGGNATMITYILLGILLSIYRYENVVSEVRARKILPAFKMQEKRKG
ncbi:MAG: FtsW/RodA/SpoVE family cell cycle protein [Dorea sp.]|nr:FtsW/RodA/SpoVE family cell cycle protein [Dorea sp.]